MKLNKQILTLLLLVLVGYSTPFHAALPQGAVSHAYLRAGSAEAPPLAFQRNQTALPAASQDRIIVLFDGPSLAEYRVTTSGRSARLTAGRQAQLRAYQARLQSEHAQFERALQAAGIPVVVHHDYTFLLNGLALSAAPDDLPRLRDLPQVAAVYPDSALFLPPETAVFDQLARAGIAGNAATDPAATGAGVRVGIIDSGIDYTHPDLGGCFGPGCRVVDGYDLVNKDGDPRDDNGHGTHCAGIVGANGAIKGVAPEVTFYAYKVVTAGGLGFASTLIAGIERAVDPDQDAGTVDAVDIISISLGAGDHPDDILAQAADAAVASGVMVVASAGNDGPEYGRLSSPGVARSALAVGAVNDANVVALFSSRGPVPGFDDIMKPQLLAPGVAVNSTWLDGTYAAISGTSMAAPHVAGAAALIKQVKPAWTPEMIATALQNKATGLDADVFTQGAGALNLVGLTDLPLLVSPGIISLGTADAQQPTWSATAVLQLRNLTSETRTITLSKTGASPGMTATLLPATLTLGPNQTGASTLSVTVDNTLARPDFGSNQGQVLIQSGAYETHVPFVYRLPPLYGESAALPYGTQTSYGVALGDLDGDGDDDLFVANAAYYGRPGNTVWFNNGEGLFADSDQELGDAFSRAVALGDLDGDGDLDAFVANGSEEDPQPDAVWINDGQGRFSRAQSLGSSHSREVQLGDLDSDGDLDAFVCNSYFDRGQGEPSLVWLNNGQGSFTDSGQRLGSALSQGADLGDLDGDGDLDAFLANGLSDREYGRANTVWLNDGHARFADSGQRLSDRISQDVALGDLDGDGDLDAFVANGGLEGGDVVPDEVWLNDGRAHFSDSGQRLGFGASLGVALADLHGDGHLDAFVAGYFDGNRIWLNDGRGNMNLNTLATRSERATDVAAADVDNDGDLDALVANGLGAANRLWFNRGSGHAASGELHVLASRTDATWRLRGPVSYTGRGSRTLSGVPAGTYHIYWGSVPGCSPPPAQAAPLEGGKTMILAGPYAGCPPSPPLQIAPPDGRFSDATPALQWLAVAGATSYRLQVDDDPGFVTPLVDKTTTEPGYKVPISLVAGRAYWRVLADTTQGSSAWSPARALTVSAVATLPFSDDFESGALRPPWEAVTTAEGRVRVERLPDSGDSHLLVLDDALNDNHFSRAAADLLVNLEGQHGLVLTFTWRTWRESPPHQQSGVYLSADYGRSWHKILTFGGAAPGSQSESVDLAAAAAEHGLAFNDHILLRFLALDERPVEALGGVAIDDVRLASGPHAPTNLTATAVGDERVELTWQDNATDESAFFIERRDGDSAPFLPLNSVPANMTHYSDNDAGCGASVAYRVRAYRAADGAYSAYSNTAVLSSAGCGQHMYLPLICAASAAR